MTTFSSKDDVLTLLVHLGYLTYDSEKSTVTIPNREVAQEYINAISTMSWGEVTRSVNESQKPREICCLSESTMTAIKNTVV